jgi:hypothetical protein
MLTLDLYHFASVARARTELRGFGVAVHAPPARTDNADDEVIQLSPGAMAARHGVEITVARATVQQSIPRDPDWNARFEALTLTGAGARLLVPPEPPGTTASAPSSAIDANAWRPPDRRLPETSTIFVPIVHVMGS